MSTDELFGKVRPTSEICKDAIDIELRSKAINIGIMIFISSMAYSSYVNAASI